MRSVANIGREAAYQQTWLLVLGEIVAHCVTSVSVQNRWAPIILYIHTYTYIYTYVFISALPHIHFHV